MSDWRTGVALAAGCLLLAGCSRPGPFESRESPRFGGSFKLIYQNPPDTLDPQRIVFLPDWEIASFVYEGLVAHAGVNAEIAPALADRWERLDGGRRWIFHLRPGVFFHDDPCFPGGRGRRLTARDVAYTLERVARRETDSANWYLLAGKIEGVDDFHDGRAPSIRGVAALDDSRVEIRLTNSYAAFLKILASQIACIVPREAVEYYGAQFATHPVGSGPFRLVRWKPLEQIVLARNPRYWRKSARGAPLPYLDSIDIRFRTDATQSILLASFLKGETHLFAAQQKLYETLPRDAAPKAQLVGVLPPSALRFLGFSLDTGSPLARHAELRRAFAMAFDRERWARKTPQVDIVLADTLTPRPLLNRSLPWHPHDPEAARGILAAHRKELNASPPTLGSNFLSGDLSSLREDLARLDVKTTLQIRPVRYYQYILQERPSLFRVSFTPSFFDPEDYYALFSSRASRDVNLTAYRSPEYDRLLDAARIEPDPARRAGLFLQLEEILRRDVPALYLSHGSPNHVVAAPQVRGVVLRFVNADLSEAWLAGPDPAP